MRFYIATKRRTGVSRGWVVALVACIAVATGALWPSSSAAQADSPTTKPNEPKDPAAIDPPNPPSTFDILRKVMEKKRKATPAIPPSRPRSDPEDPMPVTDSQPTVSPRRGEHPRYPEGSVISDRVGRIVKRDDGWYFVFESDKKVLREPPMRLLPNRYLQTMELCSANGTRPVKFRISAEVTDYKDKNFLLVRKVLIVHGTGNLK